MHHYTPAEIRFLEKNITGRSVADVKKLFNKHFHRRLTIGQVSSALRRHGLVSGRDCRFKPGTIPYNKNLKGIHLSPATEFKKGNRPATYKRVGTKRINSYGYTEVKISDPRTWKAYHAVIWGKANGQIPKSHVIIFADGDKQNFSLSNLVLVSRKELAVMNHSKLMSSNGTHTKIGKTIADIKIAIADRKREMKRQTSRNKTNGKT